MISKKLLFLTLILVLIAYFLSTRLQTGICPEVQTLPNFVPQKYMGKWYEIEKYPNIWETGQKCIQAQYSLNPNGTVNVHNSGVLKITGHEVGVSGLATPYASTASKLHVQFGYFAKGNYWLIDTDYTSYSLVYSCRQIPVPYFPLRLEYSWILSRKPTLGQKKINDLKKMLTKIKSNTKAFEATEQTNCS